MFSYSSTRFKNNTKESFTALSDTVNNNLKEIRNDNNEVLVYSISAKRPLSITKVDTEVPCTTFDFDSAADIMYAGFKDGTVLIYEPEPYLDDSSMVVTDVSVDGIGNVSHLMFSSVSVSGGLSYMNKPYLLSTDLRGCKSFSKMIKIFLRFNLFLIFRG